MHLAYSIVLIIFCEQASCITFKNAADASVVTVKLFVALRWIGW